MEVLSQEMTDIVELFVKKGVHVNSRDNEGKTASSITEPYLKNYFAIRKIIKIIKIIEDAGVIR